MKRKLLFIVIMILCIPILIDAETCDKNKITITSITMMDLLEMQEMLIIRS